MSTASDLTQGLGDTQLEINFIRNTINFNGRSDQIEDFFFYYYL